MIFVDNLGTLLLPLFQEKQSKKTKAQKDRMVKKNYELETIKAELQDKDQQLIETTAKLINLENAIVSKRLSEVKYHVNKTA